MCDIQITQRKQNRIRLDLDYVCVGRTSLDNQAIPLVVSSRNYILS
jgi:hypothetical protein